MRWLIGLAILVLSGCATMGSGPQPMESVISSPATELGKTIYGQYRSSLENIYQSVRSKHEYVELDFLTPDGIGFFKNPAQGNNESNAYLGIQLATTMAFNTLQTDFNKRAATVFSRYGLEVFDIALSQKDILSDPRVIGVEVSLVWWARDFLVSEYVGGIWEKVSVFSSKEDCKEFVERKISNQEFLRRSWIFGAQGGAELGRIELDLKQVL